MFSSEEKEIFAFFALVPIDALVEAPDEAEEAVDEREHELSLLFLLGAFAIPLLDPGPLSMVLELLLSGWSVFLKGCGDREVLFFLPPKALAEAKGPGKNRILCYLKKKTCLLFL